MGRPVVEDPYGDDSQDDQFEETTTSSPIRDVGAGPPKAATPKAATPKPRTPKSATPKAATPARSTIDDDEDDGYDDDFNESPQKPKKTADRPLKIGSLVLSVEQAKLMRVADEDELMARADKTLKKGRKAPVKKHTIDILSEPNPAKFSRERYEAEKMLRREEARVERERKAREDRESAEKAGIDGLGDEAKAEPTTRLDAVTQNKLIRKARRQGLPDDHYLGSTQRELKRPELRKPGGWLREDDAVNCTFQPKVATAESLRAQRACGYEFARDSGKKANGDEFVERLARSARHSRRAKEEAIGKQEYSYRLDKKQCPRCGAVQSYDEYVERFSKGRNCQECHVPYRHKRPAGSKGIDAWIERQDKYLQAKRERRKELVRQHEASLRKDEFGSEEALKKMNKYQKELRAKVEQGPSFLERLDEDVRRRKAAKEARAAEKKVTTRKTAWEEDLNQFLREAAAAAPEPEPVERPAPRKKKVSSKPVRRGLRVRGPGHPNVADP